MKFLNIAEKCFLRGSFCTKVSTAVASYSPKIFSCPKLDEVHSFEILTISATSTNFSPRFSSTILQAFSTISVEVAVIDFSGHGVSLVHVHVLVLHSLWTMLNVTDIIGRFIVQLCVPALVVPKGRLYWCSLPVIANFFNFAYFFYLQGY